MKAKKDKRTRAQKLDAIARRHGTNVAFWPQSAMDRWAKVWRGDA